MTLSDITYSENSPFQVPDKYNDLVQMPEDVRRTAYADGLADYWLAFPEVKAALEQINQCPASVEDRLFPPKMPVKVEK